MTQAAVNREYFNWLCDVVYGEGYKTLLSYLHTIEFTYIIPMDKNRASDGVDLRYRFAYEHSGYSDAELYLKGPCSVLEMMVALAIRCEETIMDDPKFGDRTGQWFWGMIISLGLDGMRDDAFDQAYVDETIDIFLNREYSFDGRGGLFTIKDCYYDMRGLEIWTQLSYHLNDYLGY